MSLIDNTVSATKRLGLQTVGVLASPSTIAHGLYQRPLEENGLSVILPNKRDIRLTEDLIRSVIAGKDFKPLRRQLNILIDNLLHAGAETVILGCSELSVIGQGFKNCLDPLEIITNNLIGEIK